MVFPLLLMIEFYFLIPAVTAQIFNPASELLMPAETPTNEANSETEIEALTAEIQIRKFLLNCYTSFLQNDKFLLHLFFSLKSRRTFSFTILVLNSNPILPAPSSCVFLKNISSNERMKPWFFVTFNIIISHVFPKNSIEHLQVIQKI